MWGDMSLWNVQGPLLHSGDHIVPCILTVDYNFNAPVNVTTSLYCTLVRSNLEYCSSVWSPSTVSDTKAIKSIQRAATRYILNYPEIKYDQRCTMLHQHPLSYRREITGLLYVFKCIKGYYDVACNNCLK